MMDCRNIVGRRCANNTAINIEVTEGGKGRPGETGIGKGYRPVPFDEVLPLVDAGGVARVVAR